MSGDEFRADVWVCAACSTPAPDRHQQTAAEVLIHSPACQGWGQGGGPGCFCGADTFRPAVAAALAAADRDGYQRGRDETAGKVRQFTERRENIARALHAVWDAEIPWDELSAASQAEYRRLADAAIAADGLETRVRALAEKWESTANDYRHAAEGSYDAGARNAYRHHASDLTALLDGADNGGGQ